MKYIVLGDPIPLARARIAASGRKMWDSQKQLKFAFGMAVKNLHEGKELFTGPLALDICFFMGMPKCSPKKLAALNGQPHVFTPDISNLIKFVEDAATGVLWHDDCILVAISAKKVYDPNPRTEFTVKRFV